MRLLLATLAVASLGALGAAAAPAKATKLTPGEEKWAKPVVNVWNVMNAGLLVVGDQTTADNALVPGTKTNYALTKTLATFIACNPAMKKAGEPTPRLSRFSATMKKACTHLATGAHGVANGISTIYKKHNGKLGAAQIQAAFGEFKQGSTLLAKARSQLLALGGSNIFAT
ncbi:MAG TPA: hypothetical protein VH721_00980 [Gaiellaceae bacterium]|jgi:hypothetical protein